MPSPMSSASTPPRPRDAISDQPGHAPPLVRPQGRLQRRRFELAGTGGGRAQAVGQLAERSLHLDLDDLPRHLDLPAEGQAERLAGRDPTPLDRAGQQLTIGADPLAAQADHTPLGLGQRLDLLVGQLLAVERDGEAQLDEVLEAEHALGDRLRRRGRAHRRPTG